MKIEQKHILWALVGLIMISIPIVITQNQVADKKAAERERTEQQARAKRKADAEAEAAKARAPQYTEAQLKYMEEQKAKSNQQHAPFLNPVSIHNALSNVGIGRMKPWRGDEMGWIAGTPYFDLNEPDEYVMRNNLSLYMTGDSGSKVDRVKLLLNVNNPQYAKDAREMFLRIAKKTLIATGSDVKAMKEIKRLKPFSKNFGSANVSLESKPARIENWVLVIGNAK